MAKQTLGDRLKQIYGGRLNRLDYLKGYFTALIPFLIIFASYFVVQIIEIVLGIYLEGGVIFPYFYVIFGLFALVYTIVIGLSVPIRRHHDLNQDWYYPLLIGGGLFLLSLVNTNIARLGGFIYSLALLFVKGSKADNKYGSPDKGKSIYQIIGLKK